MAVESGSGWSRESVLVKCHFPNEKLKYKGTDLKYILNQKNVRNGMLCGVYLSFFVTSSQPMA